MSWLDSLLSGVKAVQVGGQPVPFEATLDFASGFTLTDDPANGRTRIVAEGGGGGGAVLNEVATVSSHPALTEAAWQFQPIDTSGGSFTLPFPSSPNTGDMLVIKDRATSKTGGVWANACTLNGEGNQVQNRHALTLAGTYVFGQANQDQGGDVIWFMFTGVYWEVIA